MQTSKQVMNDKINIGIPVDLAKLLDTRLLIQAGSGGGKSFALRKLAEAASGHVQQIILDPEGEFVTLREKFDFALVAKEGDIPLSLRYAETLAHKLLETNLSTIIDLYELRHHERILFVQRFLNALVNAPKELWHPAMIYVDEAHIFCPESTKSESASAVIDLCTRGRKRGFCAILATQHISKLHKDAAAECLNKMIGRTGQDIHRKRAAEELGMTGKQEILSLRELSPGEFFCFGPAISNEVEKFKVAPVLTTHLRSGARQTAKPPTPNAIKKILTRLANIPEEAERELETKQQLQAEVVRLRKELSQKPAPEADTQMIRELKEQTARNSQLLSDKEKQIILLEQRFQKLLAGVIALAQTFPDTDLAKSVRPALEMMEPRKSKDKVAPTPSLRSSTTGNLPIGELKILTACAQYPDGLRRDQLTVLTGYKKSSRDRYIAYAKDKGLITQNGDRVNATDLGIEYLGQDFKPLPQGEELQAYWLGKLPKGEKVILEVLISYYPNGVSRETLSSETGYKKSSRDRYLAYMNSKELIAVDRPGEVRASENLF